MTEIKEKEGAECIKCEINGKPLLVQKGFTIIEAFYHSGRDIAHYCWHHGLSVAGVCRLCMVEIKGMNQLQVACNTLVQEGMVISSQTDKVKEAVRWGMDFHLINHPLDCPICDQAGECGLQELYMRFGQYDPDMAERKVKKRKVVDLGEKIVLDTERCILCTRCVRFTEEISKTYELGIFHRGDRSEVGVFKDKPLNNNYALNTVDICPVGALTSKDFRFRQRVWYLKSARTLCPGCSTGCNVKAFYNEEGLFRIQPVYNPEVNGHWMCDEGRKSYKFVNRENRLTKAKERKEEWWTEFSALDAMEWIRDTLLVQPGEDSWNRVGLILTGQYTNEEYEEILNWFHSLGSKELYHWEQEKMPVSVCQQKQGKERREDKEQDFDGILFRSDRNPNSMGLKMLLKNKTFPIQPWSLLEEKLREGKVDRLFVAGPENPFVFPDMKEKAQLFSMAPDLVWFTACSSEILDEIKTHMWQIPLKTYFEKDGTFVNYRGLKQSLKKSAVIVPEALTLGEVSLCLQGKGEEVRKKEGEKRESYMKTNHFYKKKQVFS